jgi:hypothetical protein
MTSRPLLLHTSALNEAEYDLYTASIRDLIDAKDDERTQCDDDKNLDAMTVGVREVRAWLRGRYPDVPISDIESVSAHLTELARCFVPSQHFVRS